MGNYVATAVHKTKGLKFSTSRMSEKECVDLCVSEISECEDENIDDWDHFVSQDAGK